MHAADLSRPASTVALGPALGPVTVTAPPAPSTDSLAEERALLEQARAAIGRRDAALPEAPLRAHEAKFPSGQLAEEREALYVQVLAMKGEAAAASSRAAEFRARWPNSILPP